jgi:photosystem II stability/assembly factor-like uncharacterized protein
MRRTLRQATLVHMKRLTALLFVVAMSACGTPAATTSASPSVAAASPTPTATPTPSAAPTTAAPTATTAPAASATLIPLPNVAQLSAPSATVVWALVASTRLFLSTDRGDTWKEQKQPAQTTDALVSFIDDHEGWLATLGSPGASCGTQSFALSHTADAGATWSPLTVTGIPPAQCKNTMTFRDPTNGLVTAYDGTASPAVYRTTDGGRTWTTYFQPLPLAPGSAVGLSVVSVRVFGSTALADVAGQAKHYAYRSSDGGTTWTYGNTAPNQQDVIAFVTATRWLQISSPGNSKETTDGGATWHAFTTDYQQAAPVPPVITFGDAQVGYATVRGAIQRTIDGGAHWTSIRTPGTF